MTYVPAALLVALGAGMIAFGIASGTDAGTVGGAVIGSMIAAAGVMSALETRRRRSDRVGDRYLARLHRSREAPRAARNLDTPKDLL